MYRNDSIMSQTSSAQTHLESLLTTIIRLTLGRAHQQQPLLQRRRKKTFQLLCHNNGQTELMVTVFPAAASSLTAFHSDARLQLVLTFTLGEQETHA